MGCAQHLAAGLHAHYLHHWYPSDVLRGSAYRAIVCEPHHMDSQLRRAAELTGIAAAQLDKLLQPARFRVMYVNPGEVKVHNTALMSSGAETIWQRQSEAAAGRLQDADSENSPQLLSLDEGQTVTQLMLAAASPPQQRRAHRVSDSSQYQPSLFPPSAAVASSSAVRSDTHSPSAPLSPASPSSVSGGALNGAEHSMVARVMAAH